MANALTIYRGEHKVWQLAVTENSSAVNLTSGVLRFVARQREPSASIIDDTDAAIVKTSAALGGITITDAVGGEFELEFVKATTNTFAPGTYFWEISLLPSGATEYVTVGVGTLEVIADYSRGD